MKCTSNRNLTYVSVRYMVLLTSNDVEECIINIRSSVDVHKVFFFGGGLKKGGLTVDSNHQ